MLIARHTRKPISYALSCSSIYIGIAAVPNSPELSGPVVPFDKNNLTKKFFSNRSQTWTTQQLRDEQYERQSLC